MPAPLGRIQAGAIVSYDADSSANEAQRARVLGRTAVAPSRPLQVLASEGRRGQVGREPSRTLSAALWVKTLFNMHDTP